MERERDFGRFFLPGPTEVRPEVLEAMCRPVMGHRGAEMAALIGGMREGLSALFRTARPVYLSTSSATGMMEAAVTNLSRRRALCLVCGAFSRRFHDIAVAAGRPADRLEVEWGEVNRPETLREALSGDPGRYDLVTVVHSETSTGVLNPLAELAAVIREFEDVMLAVDTVSSLAAAPVLTDAWELDFVLTGTQKALAVPPGLSLAVASERALARAREVEGRGYYFDLLDFERRIQRNQTPSTPAVSLLFALERQIRRIREEGLEARWRRHAEMAERTHRWVDELAEATGRPFAVAAPRGYRSPSVTAIRLPDGETGSRRKRGPRPRTGPEVAAAARERGFTIAAGYGKLRESTFRIGHMGDHTLEELEALLECLTEVLGASGGGAPARRASATPGEIAGERERTDDTGRG